MNQLRHSGWTSGFGLEGGVHGDGLDALGRELEACRHYLTLQAERVIPGVLRPKLGASDLVQETFVDARRRVDDLHAQSRDELRAWLYKIMMLNLAEQKRRYLHTARTDVRREVRLDGGPPGSDSGSWRQSETLTDSQPTPGSAAISRELLERLAAALGALDEADRSVILWRYRDHLTFAEIGRRLEGAPRRRPASSTAAPASDCSSRWGPPRYDLPGAGARPPEPGPEPEREPAA